MTKRVTLTKWRDHRIRVETWMDFWGRTGARLLIDGALHAEARASVWTGQLDQPLRAVIEGGGKGGVCEHVNKPDAIYCAQCGQKLADAEEVPVLAEVDFGLFGNRVRVAVDDEWVADDRT